MENRRNREDRDQEQSYRSQNRGLRRQESTFDREFEGGINDDDDYTGRSSRRNVTSQGEEYGERDRDRNVRGSETHNTSGGRSMWNLGEGSEPRGRNSSYRDFDQDEDQNQNRSRSSARGSSSRESMYGSNEDRSNERGYGAREDRDYRSESLDRGGRSSQRGYYSNNEESEYRDRGRQRDQSLEFDPYYSPSRMSQGRDNDRAQGWDQDRKQDRDQNRGPKDRYGNLSARSGGRFGRAS